MCLCMVSGILGNSLRFVLTGFRLFFRYFQFQREGFGMIAEHTPPRSMFCDYSYLIFGGLHGCEREWIYDVFGILILLN